MAAGAGPPGHGAARRRVRQGGDGGLRARPAVAAGAEPRGAGEQLTDGCRAKRAQGSGGGGNYEHKKWNGVVMDQKTSLIEIIEVIIEKNEWLSTTTDN